MPHNLACEVQAIRDQILVIMRQFEIKKRKGCWYPPSTNTESLDPTVNQTNESVFGAKERERKVEGEGEGEKEGGCGRETCASLKSRSARAAGTHPRPTPTGVPRS